MCFQVLDIRCRFLFILVTALITAFMVGSWAGDELRGVDAVKERGGFLERAPLRLNNVEIQEAELEDKPASIDDLYHNETISFSAIWDGNMYLRSSASPCAEGRSG